ncbi:protein NEOXANTHIN-DEFICIENT 1 [Citrus sinensis]|uniref:protein NEOXANTHIN-DEFICIENT 1 n=1 Tax=Citrus sinensis TaxID=2711 RepID=UPI0003D74425|nr:protein NEOXANTHIN-DEFICIENT 1 [Citrus sinensis]XP_006483001.1 protein NEOXANTHIN-DEFICIENT 1 [Citrus sinensis]XP_006483003.1 protein NEOXANTHIN-DEFICIENT 1 [Citrus sinensis]XP_024957223.1 protein NEOXANTHIN-DEFICIENT 1 [Citrus sinensis]XP_024957224.1 protein NEOXANTHIN-DEFICIENT 1 [Citrus sinensis]XP_024957226.1 protein NEOXANTHIN-DEFICIENT 1 [Citrus sinensis]XP_024957227.1 protein NEOXANTHIN-DEFICIENT 1 [Citrus sinensis]XP_052296107.1 protein NEOXANTHIN-DEFICIENT 1 [Citrus sinensis]XP_
MEIEGPKCTSGYGKPPWIFKGRALYQLHLVKAQTARAFIPKEFKLVEAFGYTLGGFFLASYEDSPAGVFDELVVIAGIVWNPPTSCAWAARVLVNSDQACDHGRKHVGLPSQVARFSKRITAVQGQPKGKFNGFLSMMGLGATLCSPKNSMDVQVSEMEGPSATDICNIQIATHVPTLKFDKWRGPAIKLSLPSFSGHTEQIPNILKYSCHIECRVRAVEPAKVLGPSIAPKGNTEQALEHHNCQSVNSESEEWIENGRNLSISVMLSKPIIALEFNCLKMRVEAPIVVSDCSESPLKFS